MRTTIDIPDLLYRRLKAKAASEGRSAKSLVLEAVEVVVRGLEPARQRRVRLPIVPSRRPGSLTIDNARIYDAISFP